MRYNHSPKILIITADADSEKRYTAEQFRKYNVILCTSLDIAYSEISERPNLLLVELPAEGAEKYLGFISQIKKSMEFVNTPVIGLYEGDNDFYLEKAYSLGIDFILPKSTKLIRVLAIVDLFLNDCHLV